MSTGLGLAILGFYIFLSVVVYLDYQEYLRGGKSIFFADKTEAEIKMREIQKKEIDKKHDELIIVEPTTFVSSFVDVKEILKKYQNEVKNEQKN